ncbi:MAG: RNA polymerase sigma factor (sigma-70 family) [Zhongshania aliphaticivorans]|jgi:RNA polymerase sigma factor (sigma-70 family)
MNSQQAQNLVKQQTLVIRNWVSAHCGQEEHLVPLALLYVHQRLSDQDWRQVRKYNETQPFVEFVQKLVEDALETFLCGVWFGECAKTIHYWTKRYGINSENKRQDAEDYVKNQLTKDNFARFRSYNKDKAVHFTTYISRVIRNLLIDYLRKKTPLTETETLESENDYYNNKNTINNTVASYEQQHLEEIGRWFFTGSAPKERDEARSTSSNAPDEIKLNHKERLFLRAMYKEEMTAEEAGLLPGINMNKWQAHGYHRRLKLRIKKLLKTMGYENLQSLLYPN